MTTGSHLVTNVAASVPWEETGQKLYTEKTILKVGKIAQGVHGACAKPDEHRELSCLQTSTHHSPK